MLERVGQRGEKLRAHLGHVPAVLEPNAELARDVQPGLVREAHARLQWRRVVAYQVGRLVAVEADTVAGPVREAGQPVVAAPALLLIVSPYRAIDRTRRSAGLGGLKRNLLAALNCVPYFSLSCRRWAEYPASGDVGLVAVHRAPGINEDH